ncbi:unnamed protein product [Mytilus coruscus]|uniref:Endonuclease/exonuclease/phosphatase domain-containing protein n=1 Tax=Mytilus coruscus TaxID=42192 RepID=A0A6J8B250_MYTCO|nr:unnamed protein product [Mytilus coruscus]
MPCKDNRVEKLIEFLDCIEQLHSLCTSYNRTHHIVMGGDINENIIAKSISKRYEVVKTVMEDYSLCTKDLGRTSINYKHEEISSIDYILLDEELFQNNAKKGKLKNCISELNVQDNIYKSDEEIILGWRQHFDKLAQPANDSDYDDEYYKQLALDLDNMIDICNNNTDKISVTEKTYKMPSTN